MIKNDTLLQLDDLQRQVVALARANAHAAELMAELREARELEVLLTQRNRDLLQTQTLEVDRNRVLEMVVRNEPLHSIMNAILAMIVHQDPEASVALIRVQSGSFDDLFENGLPEVMSQEIRTASQSIGWDSGSLEVCKIGREVYAELGRGCGFTEVSCHAIPGSSGRLMGVLAYFATPEKEIPQHNLLQKSAVLAGFALEHVELYKELAHQAQHDALTALPNRMLFEDRLQQSLALARRHNRKLALLWIDLDRFKLVNDTLGHDTGDELLYQVAQRLRASVRISDTVARMGGDEFAVILSDQASAPDPEQAAKRILDSLQEPMRVNEHDLLITGSIGIACFPDHGSDDHSLVRAADIAMYGAKANGKNTYEVFKPVHAQNIASRLNVEKHLRRAIHENELQLHYQPQCTPQGEIIGMEALLRWTSPELGLVSPDHFIPVAESCGLIIPLGDWVMNEACRQAAEWSASGHPVRVATNVSAQQLLRRDFLDKVCMTLERHHLSPALLDIELTESSIVSQPSECSAQLESLRRLGVTISIDDFGTGYSSLSRLQGLPIDTIKIDRQFIQAIETSSSKEAIALVQAILRMAESLQLQVVAEGVETSLQLEVLQTLGCDTTQGYYFYKPLQAAAAGELLERLRRSKRPEAHVGEVRRR